MPTAGGDARKRCARRRVPGASERTKLTRDYNTGVEGGDYRLEGLNLAPPAEGFGLWRHRNADRIGTEGWPGLHWARQTESGNYEIWAVAGEGYSYLRGVFPGEAFSAGRRRGRCAPQRRSPWVVGQARTGL